LLSHHFRDEQTYYGAHSAKVIAKRFELSQPTISRAFKELFGDRSEYPGFDPMGRYKSLCENGKIVEVLSALALKFLEPKPLRELVFAGLKLLEDKKAIDPSKTNDG
jgi:hypothetical protein